MYSQGSNDWSGEERGETNDSKKEGKKERNSTGRGAAGGKKQLLIQI